MFTDEDRQHCRLLADQAGTVLGGSQLATQLDAQHVATVAALAAALEAKDAYTGGHAHAIAEFAVAVGETARAFGRRAEADPDGSPAA